MSLDDKLDDLVSGDLLLVDSSESADTLPSKDLRYEQVKNDGVKDSSDIIVDVLDKDLVDNRIEVNSSEVNVNFITENFKYSKLNPNCLGDVVLNHDGKIEIELSYTTMYTDKEGKEVGLPTNNSPSLVNETAEIPIFCNGRVKGMDLDPAEIPTVYSTGIKMVDHLKLTGKDYKYDFELNSVATNILHNVDVNCKDSLKNSFDINNCMGLITKIATNLRNLNILKNVRGTYIYDDHDSLNTLIEVRSIPRDVKQLNELIKSVSTLNNVAFAIGGSIAGVVKLVYFATTIYNPVRLVDDKRYINDDINYYNGIPKKMIIYTDQKQSVQNMLSKLSYTDFQNESDLLGLLDTLADFTGQSNIYDIVDNQMAISYFRLLGDHTTQKTNYITDRKSVV